MNEVHWHNKAGKQAEKEQMDSLLEMARLKLEKKTQPLGNDGWSALSQKDPILAPALLVALMEELKSKDGGGGGLRSVTPKGLLVTDHLKSISGRIMLLMKA